MLKTIAVLAVGGALGTLMRHGVNIASLKAFGPAFPWGTAIVNIAGSFAIGVLIALFAHIGQPSQELRLFLVTGILGGFTTFSTFSLDFLTLWERADIVSAALYLSASVALSIFSVFVAMALVRSFVS